MSEKIEIEIVDGYGEAPHYESHKRGKNWTAKVWPHRPSPGGLKREFLDTARNREFFAASGIEAGDVLEFGADYYTGKGGKKPSRRYLTVTEITEGKIVGTYSKNKPV